MRTINGNIKVGGKSRQNQSIGLTHTEGGESRGAVNNHPAHQPQPIIEALLVIEAIITTHSPLTHRKLTSLLKLSRRPNNWGGGGSGGLLNHRMEKVRRAHVGEGSAAGAAGANILH